MGWPNARASSYELTIGTIIDHEGKIPVGPFSLEPGHMVQVVSAEVFDLPANVTGHVTYKTELTRNGVWALTVGIVDPGWKGPISTTLLNFSRADFALKKGDPFLRVSLFKHDPADLTQLPAKVEPHVYQNDIQAIAMTRFPSTFLNKEEMESRAGDAVLERIRKEGIAWIGAIAIIFTVIQVVVNVSRPAPVAPTTLELRELTDQVGFLRRKLEKMESKNASSAIVVTPRSGLQGDVK